MSRPFKKKTFRDKLEGQLSELAAQTDDLRKQVVERAPGVRDQIVEQTGELRKQVVERAPGVRDQIVSALPDKGQMLDLRDDLFERLPENVQDKLPENVKPKRSRLRKVAVLGLLTGAAAAAFAAIKRKGSAPEPYVTPSPARPTTSAASTPPVPPVPPSPSPSATAPVTAADLADDSGAGGSDETPKL